MKKKGKGKEKILTAGGTERSLPERERSSGEGGSSSARLIEGGCALAGVPPFK